MPSTTVRKVATGIAGVTGTGSLGITVTALTRIASAHTAPTGIWIMSAALAAATVLLVSSGLVLDYRRARLEIAVWAEQARSKAELEKIRLEMYRVLVEKSAGEPASAASYRNLILADALHLAVEQNGVQPADRTHGQLYAPRDDGGDVEPER